MLLGGKLTNLLHDKGFKTGVHVPMQLDLSFLKESYLDEGAELPQLLKGYVEDMKKEGIILYPRPKPEK